MNYQAPFVFVLTVALLMVGCTPDETAKSQYRLVKEQIGHLCIEEAGSSTSAVITLPEKVQTAYVVLVLDDLNVTEKDQRERVARSFLPLRLRLRFYAADATNAAYVVECGIADMTGIGGWHAPQGCYVLSVEPLPLLSDTTACPGGFYPQGRNAYPFRDGKIIAKTRFRVDVSVISAALSNDKVSLWLDYVAPSLSEEGVTH